MTQAAESSPLLLVSNRGPVTFDVDGSFTRGGGGLVTALTGFRRDEVEAFDRGYKVVNEDLGAAVLEEIATARRAAKAERGPRVRDQQEHV